MGNSTLRWSPEHLAKQMWEVVQNSWHLGFTAFGGPPVHFKILRDKYVNKLAWVDEEMYQELFAVCQALSGPASTKLLYVLNLIHAGFLPAVLGFLIWSLPGALGMYGLAIGVSNVGDRLPRAVYALLSGMNSATVGIIALAAVQLAQKAITDKLTRILVVWGACAGMMYNALWYFPLLMLIAGCTSVIYDFRVLQPIKKLALKLRGRRRHSDIEDEEVEMHGSVQDTRSALETKPSTSGTAQEPSSTHPVTNRSGQESPLPATQISGELHDRIVPAGRDLNISWQVGTTIITTFFLSFIAVMVLRGTLTSRPLLFSLFSNMFLAGTIIFGGGPVVIPLLREYVVSEGWVSPRDFLLGLAITQAFPGPNFNFAVYLGGLTAVFGGHNVAAGAIVGYLGIFLPGLTLVHGTMGIWSALRGKRWVKSALRGINAAAVGLTYTAVYRLWQVGYVDFGFETGKSLGDDPWWVVVGVTSYVGGMWFNLKPPLAIVLGSIMGLVRYGVVTS